MPAPDKPKDPSTIVTRSLVSAKTHRGIVVIEWGDKQGQLDPEDARRFAYTILREADNAETDSFMYKHFVEQLKVEPQAVWVLMTEYRKHRARLEQLAGVRTTGDEIPKEDAR